jgi:hypothetical protein
MHLCLALAQGEAVSPWLLTAAARNQSSGSWIFGGQRGTGRILLQLLWFLIVSIIPPILHTPISFPYNR